MNHPPPKRQRIKGDGMKPKCPKCGGQHVYVSKTLYPEDYVDTDNGTLVDYTCANCGYKSDQETEWTEDVS